MIFVTVGTHEQQFNRLIEYVDNLKRDGIINEEIIMQTGFSTYKPKYCKWSKLIPYKEMFKNIEEARIVITHGGPASFIMPLQIGKMPIVVPRQFKFNEHVNNHQVDFVKAVYEKNEIIIPIFDIASLKDAILNYDISTTNDSLIMSNNKKFCFEFEKIVKEITKEDNQSYDKD